MDEKMKKIRNLALVSLSSIILGLSAKNVEDAKLNEISIKTQNAIGTDYLYKDNELKIDKNNLSKEDFDNMIGTLNTSGIVKDILSSCIDEYNINSEVKAAIISAYEYNIPENIELQTTRILDTLINSSEYTNKNFNKEKFSTGDIRVCDNDYGCDPKVYFFTEFCDSTDYNFYEFYRYYDEELEHNIYFVSRFGDVVGVFNNGQFIKADSVKRIESLNSYISNYRLDPSIYDYDLDILYPEDDYISKEDLEKLSKKGIYR